MTAPIRLSAAALADLVVRACYTRRGKPRSVSGALTACRKALRAVGIDPAPMGNGNGKTGAPGFYRRVLETCPAACPQRAGCYGLGGRAGMASARDRGSVRAAVAAAAAVTAVAAVCTEHPARWHVVGDLGPGDRPDPIYVGQLVAVARALRSALQARGIDRPVLAWTYTAHAPGPYLEQLRDAGIAIRSSGTVGPWGAAIGHRRSARDLRAQGIRGAVCPAQLQDGIACVDCGLCWQRPDVSIVFLPHGALQRRVKVTA